MAKTKFFEYKSIDREGIICFQNAHIDYISNSFDSSDIKPYTQIFLTHGKDECKLKFDLIEYRDMKEICKFFSMKGPAFLDYNRDKSEFKAEISTYKNIINIDKLCIIHKERQPCFITLDFNLNMVDIRKVIDTEKNTYSIDFHTSTFISNIGFKSLENLEKAFFKIKFELSLALDLNLGSKIIDISEFGY